MIKGLSQTYFILFIYILLPSPLTSCGAYCAAAAAADPGKSGDMGLGKAAWAGGEQGTGTCRGCFQRGGWQYRGLKQSDPLQKGWGCNEATVPFFLGKKAFFEPISSRKKGPQQWGLRASTSVGYRPEGRPECPQAGIVPEKPHMLSWLSQGPASTPQHSTVPRSSSCQAVPCSRSCRCSSKQPIPS